MAHSSHKWGPDGFCVRCHNVHRTDITARANYPCKYAEPDDSHTAARLPDEPKPEIIPTDQPWD